MSTTDYLPDHHIHTRYRTAVAASAVVVDDAGLLLMLRHRHSGGLHLPVGPPSVGETVAAAAGRVAAESTGVEIEITGLVGLYNDPGDPFAVCFRGRPIGGRLGGGDLHEAVWVEPETLDELDVAGPDRRRIAHGLEDLREPIFA